MSNDKPDPSMEGFLHGLIWKTIGLGLLAGALVSLWFSLVLGGSLMAGAGLAAANAAALSWLGAKILEPEPGQREKLKTSTAFWAVLLGFKLVALLTLAFLVIVVFGVDPLGLAIGYTMFLLATLWQTAASFGGRPARPDDSSDRDDGSNERH